MKEIPQEHQDLVLDRIEQIRKNPDRLLDWDEVSKYLDTDKYPQTLTTENSVIKGKSTKAN